MLRIHFIKLFFLFSSFAPLATIKSNAQTRNTIDDFPTIKARLNKKVWSVSKNYFALTKATGSTVHLIWGNATLKRMLHEDLPLWPAAERLFVKWSSKDYLILQYWTGSGAWEDLVLPMNEKEPVQEFSNALYFKKADNLLAIEQSGDTILVVENLKTTKKQYILEKQHKCESALNGSCIAAIAISNKILYITWALPCYFCDHKKIFRKRVKLQL